jgi:hypothetical protein
MEQAGVFGVGYFVGDYQGLSAAGRNFAALWSMPHKNPDGTIDIGSIFFRDPPPAAASVSHNQVSQPLGAQQVAALLPEATHRWQAAGVETPALVGLDLRLADLGGTTLGLAWGKTIWLDANAAGWGWFVDTTPNEDAEFTTPGNQGEQNHIDLLPVLEHEIGHLLGYDHTDAGLMGPTLAPGVRETPTAVLDQLFAS